MLITAAMKNNVTWFNGHVSRKDREKLHGHKGAVVWFTRLRQNAPCGSTGMSRLRHSSLGYDG